MAKVTAKYQITIPPEVRGSLNIQPGMDIGIVKKGNDFVIVVDPINALKNVWRGRFKDRRTTDDYMDMVRGKPE
ncbi:MAG: AbrB/MazE/SpoVT family DNA-binding domain-containing protein [Desulfobacteraceae bacterium]|jgi:AbrB family looped-hinge helix DNA binding protein|nr:MAG: AbrB/MazE/SpoVT family DNA-binding domain-containing protein [Desulfobacteraceae bacterium]